MSSTPLPPNVPEALTPSLPPSSVMPGIGLGLGLSSSMSASAAGASVPQGVKEALEAYRVRDGTKVVVRFKAIGNAPIMKQNYYRITASNRFQAVIAFLRKELGWKQGDALFTYINSAFSPAPDDTVANLYKCFATEGHLIVNYSSTAAWG